MATIICPEHSSPVADAEALKKAVQGWGTDEKAVIAILGRRNAIQRKLIREAYEDLCKQDLVKRLEAELSGHFEKAVYRWILDPQDRDAVILHLAIKKGDYRVIAETSCVHSPEELLAVKRAYQTRYKSSVEEDLAKHTTGQMRQLLLGLVSTYRYNGGEIDTKLAKSEAEILHKAIIQDKAAFDHEEVVRILTTRSKVQVTATMNQYKDDHSCSITKHLRDDPSSDYLTSLRIAIRCIVDHKKYFEKVIRVALNKDDEESLTRVVVTRAEKDLLHIKELFFKRNSVSLEDAVAKATSGDYEAFLLTLLGKSD